MRTTVGIRDAGGVIGLGFRASSRASCGRSGQVGGMGGELAKVGEGVLAWAVGVGKGALERDGVRHGAPCRTIERLGDEMGPIWWHLG